MFVVNAFQSVAQRSSYRVPSKPPKRLPRPRPEQYPVIGKPKIELGLHGAPTMQKISKWHAEDAPHVGWWLTKTPKEDGKSVREWRWWIGTHWSLPVRSGASARLAAQAAWQASYRDDIRWCYEWPDGARVQRINPVTGEVTGG